MNLSDKTIAKIGAAGVILVLAFVVFVTTRPALKAGNFNPTGGSTYLLKASISRSQTTIPLTSFTEPGSDIPYTMTYLNSDIEYATLAPNNPTGSEFISFTGITQNTDGSATLTGVTRGLARTPGNTGCVASTTLAHSFPGQTSLIISNSPCFYSEYAVKRNSQNISGVWNYDQYPVASTTLGNATTSRQLISLGQAQGLANQGAATSTESVAGIVRLATAAQAASSTDLGVDIPLVMQAKNATNTPQSGCASGYSSTAGAGCSVIAQLTGKIRQTFLNLAETYVWSALHTFSSGLLATASSTATATTTIVANSVTARPFVLNGIAYAFPSTQGSAGTSLQTDGAGTLSWSSTPHYSFSPGVSATLGASASGFATSSAQAIPAGIINASSTIDIYGNASCTNNGGGSSQCDFYVRTSTGVTLATFSVTPGTSIGLGTPFHVVVMNQSSASSQKNYLQGNWLQTSGTIASAGFSILDSTTATTVNLASATSLVVVVKTASANNGGSTITLSTVVVNP